MPTPPFTTVVLARVITVTDALYVIVVVHTIVLRILAASGVANHLAVYKVAVGDIIVTPEGF